MNFDRYTDGLIVKSFKVADLYNASTFIDLLIEGANASFRQTYATSGQQTPRQTQRTSWSNENRYQESERARKKSKKHLFEHEPG